MSEGDGPRAGSASRRVLLVEDDAGDALLVEELLLDAAVGAALRWVGSLADALAAADAEPPTDCVLLDLDLPDSSGLDTVRAVLAAFPDTAVVVLSGRREADLGARAVAAGAQDFLVKGEVTPDTLDRALRYALSRKAAEQASAELLQARMHAVENARLERGLLPFPLLRSARVGMTARYRPGRSGSLLGGDFYDVVETGDGLVHAVIGDVSGHGPGEAALGVSLRAAWRSLTLGGHTGADLLNLMEQMLVAERERPDVFATCTTLTLDPHTAAATVYLAGHHEPLLLTDAKAAVVPCDLGIALGILPGVPTWYPTRLALPPGGALMLYTDGLIEGYVGPGAARLGTAGLIDLLTAVKGGPPDAFLDAVIAEALRLNAGRHIDDTAALWLTWS